MDKFSRDLHFSFSSENLSRLQEILNQNSLMLQSNLIRRKTTGSISIFVFLSWGGNVLVCS